jgi:C-terminal domain on Strawberry notch homologue
MVPHKPRKADHGRIAPGEGRNARAGAVPRARDQQRDVCQRIDRGDVAGFSLGALEDATRVSRIELPPVTTFLNRLLALAGDMQAVLFSAFKELLDARIEGAWTCPENVESTN